MTGNDDGSPSPGQVRVPEADELIQHRHPLQITRNDHIVAALLAFTLVFLGSLRRLDVCGAHHDDAILVATAKALAMGDGYRSINLPGSPWQTKYPFLYPALISPIWLFRADFPGNLVWFQAMSLLSAGAMIWAVFLYLVRFGYASRPTATLALATCATAPVMLLYSSLVMSEMPFALVVVAALWTLENRLIRPVTPRGADFAQGFILSLPFLVRSIGLSVTIACVGILALRKRTTASLIAGVTFGSSLWVAWILFNDALGQNDHVRVYDSDYIGWWINSASSALPRIVGTNLLGSMLSIPAIAWAGLTHEMAASHLVRIYLLPVTILSVLAIIAAVKSGRAVGVVLVAYLLPIVLWPWPPARFLVPLLPMFVAIWYEHTRNMGAMQRFRSLRLFTGLVIGIVIGLNVAMSSDILLRMREPRISDWPHLLTPEQVPHASYEAVFEWIRTNTNRNATLASTLDSMMYLHTGRQTAQPFSRNGRKIFYEKPPSIGEVSEVLDVLKTQQVSHFAILPILNQPQDDAVAQLIRDLRREAPECLTRVYVGSDRRFEVYSVHLQNCNQSTR